MPSKIKISIENLKNFVSEDDLKNIQPSVTQAHEKLTQGQGEGAEYLGWLNLPSTISPALIRKIEETAAYIRKYADVLVVIGIGGSYLGAKAAIEFTGNCHPPSEKRGLEIHFAGQNISSDYLTDLLENIKGKRLCLNVISKSGTTTEPAIAYRILKEYLEKRHGKKEAQKRIIVTTDQEKGALKKSARQEGYLSFVIPDDIGGRFSVLTPVGLLPMATAGINIREVIKGAKNFRKISNNPEIDLNPAYLYAAARNLLYRRGKNIEILAGFHPALHYLAEWWKQLAGESEGKNGRGIFPAAVDFTTDLHSMGQWIQEGNRIIFETFLTIEKSKHSLKIPRFKNDDDGLNYLAGKSLDYINNKAYQGTALAHLEGGVPNLTITLKDRSAQTLGEVFYFFEKAIALSGYLQGINPFDQPGVEFYKKNMFKLLGKPQS